MADKISIPRTIGAAEKRLNSLGELATTTEWERAAIVAAYVQPNPGGRPSKGGNPSESNGFESATQFATRNIHGLTSAGHVMVYWHAWFGDDATFKGTAVVDGKRERPVAGRSIELPTDPWPPTRTGTDGMNTDEGADKTIDKLIAKHGAEKIANKMAGKAPEAVAKQVSQPKVAAAVVGSMEGMEIAAKVMSNPSSAQVVLGDEAVDKAVVQARVDNMRAVTKRPQATAPERNKVAGATTLSVLKQADLEDEVSHGLDGLLQTALDGVDDDTAENMKAFITDTVFAKGQGILDLISMRGHDMTTADFDN